MLKELNQRNTQFGGSIDATWIKICKGSLKDRIFFNILKSACA